MGIKCKCGLNTSYIQNKEHKKWYKNYIIANGICRSCQEKLTRNDLIKN